VINVEQYIPLRRDNQLASWWPEERRKHLPALFCTFYRIPEAGIIFPIQFFPGSIVYLSKERQRSLESQEEQANRNRAVEHAVRAERRRLFDFILRRVRSPEDAEDILQDVFYQLVSSYSVTEPIEQLTSWLFTVTRNKIIDWYRRRRPESSLSQRIAVREGENDDSLPLNLEEILFDPSETPDQAYARSVVWSDLADALDELPENQRQVFIMHELEGKSFKEIAVLTGEPVNTLLSRKRYAVLYLRERLQDLYNEFEQP
jgi:RNA polymerase sigma factor (sigma-70 family)